MSYMATENMEEELLNRNYFGEMEIKPRPLVNTIKELLKLPKKRKFYFFFYGDMPESMKEYFTYELH